MDQLIGSIGLTLIILVVIFITLCILTPIAAYAAQKHAYKCWKELERIRKQLEQINSTPSG
jgi:hypothetical protein